MAELLWDASALVKRYAAEAGSDTVDALFQFTPPLPMVAPYSVSAPGGLAVSRMK